MTQEQKDRLELWAKALQSGEFQQGQDFLKDEDKYCCLGVACEIYRRQTGMGEWHRSQFETNEEDGSRTIIPSAVGSWYGICQDPLLDVNGVRETAITHNDRLNASFADIAAGVRKLIAGAA